MIRSPIVSCVMPVHNSSSTVARATQSVLNSDMESLELIVVDDGSSDKSIETILDQAKGDRRVRILEQSQNGPGQARNLGMRYAQGKYITFLDSDDQFGRGAIRKVLMSAERRHLDIVSYELPKRYFEFTYETIPTLPTKGQFFRRSLVEDYHLSQPDAPSGQDGLFGHILLSVSGAVGHQRGAKYLVHKDRGYSQYARYWKSGSKVVELLTNHFEYLMEEYDRLQLWELNTHRLTNFLFF